MAEQSRDPSTSKKEMEKKQPETVLLSAEELRAIAGGAGIVKTNPGSPTATPKDILGK